MEVTCGVVQICDDDLGLGQVLFYECGQSRQLTELEFDMWQTPALRTALYDKYARCPGHADYDGLFWEVVKCQTGKRSPVS